MHKLKDFQAISIMIVIKGKKAVEELYHGQMHNKKREPFL